MGYISPTLLAKWFPTVSDFCWRCSGTGAFLNHIWWECGKTKNFWKMVHTEISKSTDYLLPFPPFQKSPAMNCSAWL